MVSSILFVEEQHEMMHIFLKLSFVLDKKGFEEHHYCKNKEMSLADLLSTNTSDIAPNLEVTWRN